MRLPNLPLGSLLCLLSFSAAAQVKIGDNPATINAASILELESSTAGFVPPRVALTNVLSPSPLPAGLLIGTMVYSTAAPTGGSGPGIYLWNGSRWNALIETTKAWLLQGNAGTVPGTDFLGTSDNQPLQFRQNNVQAGYVGATTNRVTAFGRGAANNNGAFNLTAFGTEALQVNSSGTANTAIGDWAMNLNLTGSNNVAVGSQALRRSLGSANTAIGAFSMQANMTNGNNTAVGSYSMFANTGTENAAFGTASMQGNTSGSYNAAFGTAALSAANTGNHNTSIGYLAGSTNTSGFQNTYIGALAKGGNNLQNATALGYNAIADNSNSLILGQAGADAPDIGIGLSNPSYPFHFYSEKQNGSVIAMFQDNNLTHGNLILGSVISTNGTNGAQTNLFRAEGLGVSGNTGHKMVGFDSYIVRPFGGFNTGFNAQVSGGDANTGMEILVTGNGNNTGLKAEMQTNVAATAIIGDNTTAASNGQGSGVTGSTRQAYGAGGDFRNYNTAGVGVFGLGNGLVTSPVPATGSGGLFVGTEAGAYLRATNQSGTGLLASVHNYTPETYFLGAAGAFTGYNAAIWGIAKNGSGTGIVASGNNLNGFSLGAGGGGAFTGLANGISVFTYNPGEAVYTSTPGGVTRVNYHDGTTQYKIMGVGTVSTVVKDLHNKPVIMAAPEAPEILFEDFGAGTLVNGFAHIDLDPVYAKNVTINDKHPLRVFIQLEGDCNGVFVTGKTASGFDVKERAGGTSNTPFQWHVVCNRADERLNDGSTSQNADFRFKPMKPEKDVLKNGQ